MLYGEMSRDQMEKYATHLFLTAGALKNKRTRRQFYANLLDKFNMKTTVAEEMINFKRDIKEFSSFEIFCVLYFLDQGSLKKFFTQSEIDNLAKEKFEDNKAEFLAATQGIILYFYFNTETKKVQLFFKEEI